MISQQTTLLSIVSTPIGNLEDITLRAIRTLKECDLILSEDTRKTGILLKHLEIVKPMKSFHKFSEAKNEEFVIDLLKQGQHITLVSDAGTPLISDPGERLVKRCIDENIHIEAIPGACSPIQALVSSGLPAERFEFVGFLPKKGLERILIGMYDYPGTSICFTSPHRILKILKRLHEMEPEREVTIARELTKKFEEVVRGTPGELLKRTYKGEIVSLNQLTDAEKLKSPLLSKLM